MPNRHRGSDEWPPSAYFRKARIYADADIEAVLVEFLRGQGVNIVSAHECGYESRDDRFQLAGATRQKRFLLTKNGTPTAMPSDTCL